MHIIFGFLGSVVTILWLLHRLAEMGIDLGGLNPWLWQRRRKWRKQYEANPIFSIESPMESAALLVIAVAKADGEMSSLEKKELLTAFDSEFGISKRDAAGLLISSNHLLGSGDEIRRNLKGVLQPSLEAFTTAQLSSTLTLVRRISEVDGPATEMQEVIVTAATKIFQSQTEPKGKWD